VYQKEIIVYILENSRYVFIIVEKLFEDDNSKYKLWKNKKFFDFFYFGW